MNRHKTINFEKKVGYTTNKSGHENVVKKKNVFLTWRCLAFNFALSIPILYLYTLQCQKRDGAKGAGKTTIENIGKPLIGGDFTLVNQKGEIVTNQNFRNRFCLIYFGFTYCPDICPQELEKQSIVIEKITRKHGNIITPIFISVDPNRDTVAQINNYCKSFSEQLVGLTGTKELIKSVAKSFRVYYNEHITDEGEEDAKKLPTSGMGSDGIGNAKRSNDNINHNSQNKYNYLIDHSIIHYLIDTDGNFVDFFGKNCTANEMFLRISEYLNEHIEKKKKGAQNS
ncbi:Cg3 protein, putative [Plasmodium ovale]|uniref:Cg3 protein, putative n=1 Tax=Plasmodium ovale TaxID=36330 RepID=A0A1D3KYP5_PLAOA|nr:Cg3 protein, putative [Plasmodium ovale]